MEKYYSVPLTTIKGIKVRDEFVFKVKTERIIATKTEKGYKELFTDYEIETRDILKPIPCLDGSFKLTVPSQKDQEEISFKGSILYVDDSLNSKIEEVNSVLSKDKKEILTKGSSEIREATATDFALYYDNFDKSQIKKQLDEEALYDENFKVLPKKTVKEFNETDKLKYYRSLRKYEYEQGSDIKGLRLRKVIHPVLRQGVKFDRLSNKQTSTLLNKKDYKKEKRDLKRSKRPIIYAITHVGMYDMPIVCEEIKDNFYILCGDPETMYENRDGFFVEANGVVYIEANSKTDRFISKEKCIHVLENEGNLLMYPEGIWNVDSCKLMLDLYPGIVEMAYRTNALIVPVGIEQYGKRFVTRIGQSIDINPFFADGKYSDNNISRAKEEVRNKMASEKWYIIEQEPHTNYEDIPDDYEKKYIQERIDEWPHYTFDTFKERTYKEPGKTSPDEAFSYLKKIS